MVNDDESKSVGRKGEGKVNRKVMIALRSFQFTLFNGISILYHIHLVS